MKEYEKNSFIFYRASRKTALNHVKKCYPAAFAEGNLIALRNGNVFLYMGSDLLSKVDRFFISKKLYLERCSDFDEGKIVYLPKRFMKKKRYAFATLAIGISFLFIAAVLMFFSEKKQIEQTEQKRIAQEQILKQKKERENESQKEKQFLEIEGKLKTLLEEKSENPYFVQNCIRSCLNKGCLIESESITGNDFSLEVKCPDGTETLRKFETSPLFEKVSFKRENSIPERTDSRLFVISGRVKKAATEGGFLPDSNLSLDEKIKFLEGKIDSIKTEKAKKSQKDLWQSISEIKEIIAKNSLSEEYISSMQNGGTVFLEISLSGKSSHVFSSIEKLSEKFEIESLEIKNHENGNRVHFVLRINTFIPSDRLNTESLKKENQIKFSPAQIAVNFVDENAPKERRAEKSGKSENAAKVEKKAARTIKKYAFLGISKDSVTGVPVLLVKDISNGRIDKIKKFNVENNAYYFDLVAPSGEVCTGVASK